MAKTATKKKTQASTAPPGVLNGIPLSLLLLAAFVLGFAICYGMFAMQAGAGSATTTTDLDSTPAGKPTKAKSAPPMKTINQIRNRRKKGVKKEREAYAALSQSEVRHLNKARSQHVESYVHPVSINVDDVFTPEECDRIIKINEEAGLIDGGLGSTTSDKSSKGGSTRISQVRGVFKTPENAWIYERIFAAVQTANKQNWNYGNLGLHWKDARIEAVQFAKYVGDADRGNSGRYRWHKDTGRRGGTGKRRLSISIQLSDPSDYQGGELQFKDHNGVVHSAAKKRGSAIIFPSFNIHQVADTTAGARYSLVNWYQAE